MSGSRAEAIKFLGAYWPHGLGAVGVIAMGLPNLAAADGSIVLGPIHTDDVVTFWFGAALFAISFVVLAIRERHQQGVDAELQELTRVNENLLESRRRLLRNQLIPIGRQLGYYSNERLSLYLRRGPFMILVARFSDNPAFEERTGIEDPWPIEQGILGLAWQERQWAETELPDSSTDFEGWLAQQVGRCRVPESVARSLRMKSRTYAAIRIENRYGSSPLGVLIAESTGVPSGIAAASSTPPQLDPAEIYRRIKSQHMVELYQSLQVCLI